MEARNRRLPEWFTRLKTGQLKLPRFQRLESWGRVEVEALLNTVLRGRPIGATLVLEIGDKEPFESRVIEGVTEGVEERTTEHLLDGQQRLTALWKSLTDGYCDRTYLVVLNPSSDRSRRVTSWARWRRQGARRPLWVDRPVELLRRGLAPIRLLDPEGSFSEIDDWCDEATSGCQSRSRRLRDQILNLRERVKEANLPFLALPVGTSPSDAIDAFIVMNTSSVRLTTYDIVVAKVEGETGGSLRSLERELRDEVPMAERYVWVPDLVLRVAALRQGRTPTDTSFRRLDCRRLVEEWPAIKTGIAGAVAFLQEERVLDGDRLPTVPVVQVLAAIWSLIPHSSDEYGRARTVLRRYLWRSFFTNRYDRATNTAAFQDHQALKAMLVDGIEDIDVPAFDDEEHPLPDTARLLNAGWPRQRSTIARAVLAAALRAGGLDFADGTPVSAENLSKREHHHLFPASLLKKIGGLEDRDINKALNCALVTWKTNREIAAQDPVAYLRKRVDGSALGEDQIRKRLDTHIIPFKELNVGGYSGIPNKDERAERIRADYQAFMLERAKMVLKVVRSLCDGEETV